MFSLQHGYFIVSDNCVYIAVGIMSNRGKLCYSIKNPVSYSVLNSVPEVLDWTYPCKNHRILVALLYCKVNYCIDALMSA